MDKSWAIDRDVVAIIKSMRALVRSEFGAAVSLTDDGVFEQLNRYADMSRNEKLKELQTQLHEAVHPPEPEPEPDAETPHKVYRGHVVETAESAEPSETKPAVPKPRNSGTVRMYRGQRVSD